MSHLLTGIIREYSFLQMPRDREAIWLEPKEKQRTRNILLSAPEAAGRTQRAPDSVGR